ncbi:MAG: hypothetical protein WD733_04740 [Bryobacterales bacterium]
MTLILITVGLIALIMLAMSVGVVLKGRCLRGSCGGPEILDPNGDPLSCATCPNRNKAEEKPPVGLRS